MTQPLYLHEIRVTADDDGLWPGLLVEDGTTIATAVSAAITGLQGDGSTIGQLKAALATLAPPSTFAGGVKTVAAAATPEKLVAVATPCRAVWIGAPCDATGAATNTETALAGDSATQSMPIAPTDFHGQVFPIDDASKIYVKAGADGESLNYRIFA